MIVVDTNIILALWARDERGDETRAVLRRDGHWVVPRLWRSEHRNALSLYVRKRLLALAEAQALQAESETLLSGRESEPDSREVLELSSASGCTAYDCEFVALARTLRVPLVTRDVALCRAFPALVIAPAEFLSL